MIDLTATLWAPDKAVSNIESNIGVATSPFTGSVQVTELPGARWVLTFSYSDLSVRPYGQKMKAVMAALRGGAMPAHIIDLSYVPRRLTEPGAPLINGANQVGGTLKVKGLTPSTTVYQMGDQVSYLSTDGCFRMHLVMEDCISDGAGNATLAVLPPLRNPPVADYPVNSIAPKVTARLSDGGSVSTDGNIVNQSLTMTEHLYGLY